MLNTKNEQKKNLKFYNKRMAEKIGMVLEEIVEEYEKMIPWREWKEYVGKNESFSFLQTSDSKGFKWKTISYLSFLVWKAAQKDSELVTLNFTSFYIWFLFGLGLPQST